MSSSHGHTYHNVTACGRSSLVLGNVYNIEHTEPLKINPLGLCFGSAPIIKPDDFVGRIAEIEAIDNILQSDDACPEPKRVVLGGIGGVGKTQLAIAYARRHKQTYASVIWLNATSKPTLSASIRSISSAIVAAEDLEKLNDEQVLARFRGWLSHPENTTWLLIFDNYDDPDLYDARSGRKNVKEDSGAQRLAIRLGGLPLALASAAAYLRNRNITFQQYLDAYEQRWQIDPGRDVKLPEYKDRTLYTTWNLTYIRLEAEDAEAAQMLKLLAYFDDQEVWYKLLHAGLSDDSPRWLQKCLHDEISFASVMGSLVDYCLVEVQQATESYTLHNCVHDWTLGELNQAIDSQLYFHVFDSVAAYYDSIDIQSHTIRLAHPRFLACHQLDDFLPERAENVLTNTEWLRYCRHPEAEQMCLRILASFEKALGPEHISTTGAVYQLASVYGSAGKFDKAEYTYLRALEGYQKEYGTDNKLTLRTLYTLAQMYRDLDKLDEAEDTYIRALRGWKNACGTDNHFIDTIIVALGSLYRGQGRLCDAETMYEDALSTFQTVFPLHKRKYISVQLVKILEENVRLAESKQSRAVASRLARLIQLVDEWMGEEEKGQVLPKWLIRGLAKALISVKDDMNAQIAILKTAGIAGCVKIGTPLYFTGVGCDGCRCNVTLATGRHICRSCKGIDLCNSCMSAYTTKTITIRNCSEHEFFDAGSKVSEMLKSPEFASGIDMDAWMAKLK
ncbi:hypothetical protein LTR05_001938 [Lithohypha guttulata]|uniref:Uncharacterized protein n=1 Tax=Lithohypha guttulata TaxID=1690604 RepID=A0AAN7T752_9EURO|nr:hypothetical protein LTR05_001938 [Lithohypha guttulata]